MFIARDFRRARRFRCTMAADIAIHAPCHPQQQQPTRQRQPHDPQQPCNGQRKGNAQHQCRDNADGNHLLALGWGKPCSQGANHDGIVSGKHHVDHQHLQERRKGSRTGDVAKVTGNGFPDAGNSTETFGNDRRASTKHYEFFHRSIPHRVHN